MKNTKNFIDTKPHYELLDGLRGLAALIVVCYHIFEGFSFAEITNGAGDGVIRNLNHGYLSVDFFFLLSGFVLSYAYDDRWKQMSMKTFFKRRLVRLHPMLIMGALVGLICFLIGGAKQWDGSQVPFYLSLICFLLSIFMIPAYPSASYEVRGNGEMFPLNGPTWSLFFEYIGNILYAIFIRRLSNKALTLFVILVGGLHTFYSLANLSGYGSFGVGWTLDAVNLCGGMLRMLFPFSVGMLIARNFRPLKIKYSFLICPIILIAALFLPYIEGLEPISFNGLYESFCIVVLFPLILLIGASDRGENKLVNKTSNLLGELSYPLYIVHYPIMYLFYQWLIKNELYSLKATLPYAVSVVALSIFLAYLLLRFYDKPLRKRLAKKMQKTITSR